MAARDPLLARLRDALTTAPPQPPDPTAATAAVLVLIDPDTLGLPLLFIERAATLRLHAGQIGFPGGSRDPGDTDVVATALREAEEEVGLAPDNVEVVGTLSPLMTAISNLWLTPVVGLQRGSWTVRGDGHEVADWFRAGLVDLMSAPHHTKTMTRDGVSRDVHFYTTADNRVIWGVTGAIVADLLSRVS